jgi:hypothetical protein
MFAAGLKTPLNVIAEVREQEQPLHGGLVDARDVLHRSRGRELQGG